MVFKCIGDGFLRQCWISESKASRTTKCVQRSRRVTIRDMSVGPPRDPIRFVGAHITQSGTETDDMDDNDITIPFSLDESISIYTEGFDIMKRMIFWDGPIRAYLLEHGYTLNTIENLDTIHEWDPEDRVCFMYPAFESAPGFPADQRFAFIEGTDSEYERVGQSEKRPYLAQSAGKVFFGQETACHEHHVAFKLVRNGSPEHRALKLLSAHKEIRGLVPVLEMLPFRGHWLAVMPRWDEGVVTQCLWPRNIRQTLDLFEDLLSGLAFLHEHRIVHRDIRGFSNVLVNHLAVDHYHADIPTRCALLANNQIKTGIFDYNLSVIFPADVSLSRARSPWSKYYGMPAPPVDICLGEYQFNPFASDVASLGADLRALFHHFTPVAPLLAPLIDGMVHWDPTSRLTASDALELLRSMRQEYDSEVRNLPAPARENSPRQLGMNLWDNLPPPFVERWKHFRTPSEPLGVGSWLVCALDGMSQKWFAAFAVLSTTSFLPTITIELNTESAIPTLTSSNFGRAAGPTKTHPKISDILLEVFPYGDIVGARVRLSGLWDAQT
ncbi:unnamed protein product [Mycena citricolor]|uniref:Protein kinase domain-containing protein n=1 Tax=Mycena citricolor TaxID=2018698 RepID=A0AAD2HHT5_9AGAR|nr:unnamed protein product [Mycena citricolor]